MQVIKDDDSSDSDVTIPTSYRVRPHDHSDYEPTFFPSRSNGQFEPEELRLLSESEESDDVELSQERHYTVEDAVEHMGFGLFQAKFYLVSGVLYATDALEMLLLSVLSPVLRCEWSLTEWQVALLTTVVFTGMFLGSSFWGSMADKHGRHPIINIGSWWIFYFGILTTFSPNYFWILFLRGLVGSGFGGALQNFTLMAEYLPSKHRAKLLVVNSIWWAMGSSFEVVMAYFIIPTYGWRYLVGFSALPMIITILSLRIIPESARFLLAAGKKDQAEQILRDGTKLNRKVPLRGTLKEGTDSEGQRGRFKDLFSPHYLRTTLQLWVMWFAIAFSYYGSILVSSEILENAEYCGADIKTDPHVREVCHCKLHTKADYVTMIISTFGEFCAIPLNLLIVDWLGRRATLAVDYGGACVCFLLIQICTTRTWLTLFIFGVRAFTAGIFNISYLYTTEVYPTTVRSVGLGSCSAMARVGAMITPFIAQVLLQYSVTTAVWVYGVVCGMSAIISCLLPYETLGRELPQTVHATPIRR